MSKPSEDDAWRQIVENFGDRPDFPESPAEDKAPQAPEPEEQAEGPEEEGWFAWVEEEGFVPDEPPPVPAPSPRRLAAWTGVVGAPLIAILALIFGVNIGDLFGLVLITWFVGGFVYLVATMDASDPPEDGGAVV